jgi:hypothetical protein
VCLGGGAMHVERGRVLLLLLAGNKGLQGLRRQVGCGDGPVPTCRRTATAAVLTPHL